MSDLVDRQYSDLLERLARINAYLGPLTPEETAQLVTEVQRAFPTFGGHRKGDGMNPISHWAEGKPAIFAAGAVVAEVVAFIEAREHEIRLKRPLEP